MSPADKQEFAATAFKRLWHAGYRGRFGFFAWPTYYFNGYNLRIWIPHIIDLDIKGLPPVDLFNESEHRSWLSAPALRNTLDKLDGKYPGNVTLVAHSLGNAAAGEALRMSGAKLRNYFASQAAVSAHMYDPSENLNIAWKTLKDFINEVPDRINKSLGPNTPNIFANYAPPVKKDKPSTWKSLGVGPYFAPTQVQGGSMAYHNYYNGVDFALNWPNWEFNTQAKPRIPGVVSAFQQYDYRNNTDIFGKVARAAPGVNQFFPLSFPNDRFEIFASAAESHSIALGRGAVNSGPSTLIVQKWHNFDLKESKDDGGLGYDKAHKYHSGQFRGPIWDRRFYWKQLLEDMHDVKFTKP